MQFNRTLLFMSVVNILVSCSDKDNFFESLPSQKTGITFNNTLTSDETFNIVDYLYFYNGGGVAIGDINNDGLEDLYFSGNQVDNQLYLNRGNLQFEDITSTSGTASQGPWKTGVVMVDVNADGWLDIYVCRVGKYKGMEGTNELYINNRDLTFTEAAADFGLDFKGFSTQAAFFDFDLDNDLDVYLLNHSVHTERTYGSSKLRYEIDTLAGDRLLRNDGGIFTDITRQAGIYSSHIGYGLGVGISDFDDNGYPDIYVCNDFHENDYLYMNNGDGRFSERIEQMIGHTSRSSMGNDIADINNDGLSDILSLDMLPNDEQILKNSAGEDPYDVYQLKLSFGYQKQYARNTLQLNQGNGLFSEVALMSGVAATDWSWSSLFADFDNDGDKDLFISNGIVKRPNDLDYINFISNEKLETEDGEILDEQLIAKMPEGAVSNQVFSNDGSGNFIEMSKEWGLSERTLSNGTAYSDLDNDGDLDLIINNINQPASVLENTTDQLGGNNYLQMVFDGPDSNPFGIGVKVSVYVAGKSQRAELFNVRGYQSSVSNMLFFGLDSINKADSIVVIWPDGKSQSLYSQISNQRLSLAYENAVHLVVGDEIDNSAMFVDLTVESGILYAHEENLFNDFNQQYLIPKELSKEGPSLSVADVTGDGSEDLYISGAANSDGVLLVQTTNGDFEEKQNLTFVKDAAFEEVDSDFLDVDGDGDLDLYLVSAGNEFPAPSPKIKDRLLINQGRGVFLNESGRLPEDYINGAVVKKADFDQDGDLDLFVGGRVRAGKYGVPPESHLYQNDGAGNFEQLTDQLAPELKSLGMVTDAEWSDLNGDGTLDLMVVGEWMPITVFHNKNNRLVKQSLPELAKTSGWWNEIEATDLNNDGRTDFVLGNLGINSKHVPSAENPLRMYLSDFDKNTSLDQIITYSVEGREYTMANKDEIVRQMPVIKKLYVNYSDFSGKQVDEVIKRESLDLSYQLKAEMFESVVLMSGDKGFQLIPLPRPVQKAPIRAILSYDFNEDGFRDLMIAGNLTGASPYLGAYDASHGDVLLGNGDGTFRYLAPAFTGLNLQGDITDMKVLKSDRFGDLFVIGRNNRSVLVLGVENVPN